MTQSDHRQDALPVPPFPNPWELSEALVPDACPVCSFPMLGPVRPAADLLSPGRELREHREDFRCPNCRSPLRDLTLAAAIATVTDWKGSLQALLVSGLLKSIRLLEIGEAGTLHAYLKRFLGSALVTQPCGGMQCLPFADQCFDLVLHSDIVDQVPDPIQGLRECRRVLHSGGILLMTMPLAADRLSRRHSGASPESHGAASAAETTVHGADSGLTPPCTQYGADFFLDVIAAGWDNVTLRTLGGATCFAVMCVKG